MNFPNRIRVSVAATDKLKYLKSKTGVTPNILCRFAINLALRDSVGLEDNARLEFNGQEFNASTLFGGEADIYYCLISEFIKKNSVETDVAKAVGALVEVGIHKMGHVRSVRELADIACR